LLRLFFFPLGHAAVGFGFLLETDALNGVLTEHFDSIGHGADLVRAPLTLDVHCDVARSEAVMVSVTFRITPASERANRRNPRSDRGETTVVTIAVVHSVCCEASTIGVTSEAISSNPVLTPEKSVRGMAAIS
jgi:hypothetical protein